MPFPKQHVPEKVTEKEVTVKMSVCPECSRVANDTVYRVRDPKGVHKCQACRSEMTPEYAAKLPEVKASKAKKLGVN